MVALKQAIEREDFETAQRVQGENKELLGQLSVQQQLKVALMNNLRSKLLQQPFAREDLVEASHIIDRIGNMRDPALVPSLLPCLHVDELQAVAYEALWMLYTAHSDKQVTELLHKAATLIQESRLDEAQTTLIEVLRLDPDFADANSKLGSVRFQQGHYQDAEVLCRLALSMQPLHIGALSGLGLSLYYLRKWDDALEVLNQLLAIHPGLDEIAQLRQDVVRQRVKAVSDSESMDDYTIK